MIHRHRLYLVQALILLFLTVPLLGSALAVELNGTVTQVTKTEVMIKLGGTLLPQINDIVRIQENIPGLGLIPVQGEWRVTAVTLRRVKAVANGDSSTPQAGQAVVIESSNPIPASSLSQDSEALYQQGTNYLNGKNGQPKNTAKGLELLHSSAALGNMSAQAQLGYIYSTGKGVAVDPEKSFKWSRKAAKQGHKISQYNVALDFSKGNGVGEDKTEAAKWFRKAADQNYLNAQYRLGRAYYDGDGVRQDYSQAAAWYTKAAQSGHINSQKSLGSLYENGEGIPRDFSQAYYWYKKAADQNDAWSQQNLGFLFDDDDNPEKNAEKSFFWFKKAAEQDLRISQKVVGRYYEYGHGTPKDIHKAMYWYQKSSDQGYKGATEALERLNGTPSPASASASASDNSTGGTTAAHAGQVPAGARQIVSQIQSASSGTQQRGAKLLYRSPYKTDPAVLEVVHQELLKGYNINVRDRHHIDAMGWLCATLGTAGSGSHRYKATLEKISQTAQNRKLRKTAYKFAVRFR